MNKQRIGRLVYAGQITPELIKARCDCGFPSVIMTAEDWNAGLVLGCASEGCHVAEAEQREKEAAEEAREAAATQKELAREQRLKATYLLPMYDQLTLQQKRLFRVLAQSASFDVAHVAKLLGVTDEEAWGEVLGLLECNLLIERVGVMGDVRPCSKDEPYAASASMHSSYTPRGIALRQMKMLEGRTAEAKPPMAPAKERQSVDDAAVELVKEFITARCAVSADAYDSPAVLRSRYCAWAEDAKREVIAAEEFAQALDALQFPLKDGRRRGLRLKTTGQLLASAMETAEAVA